MQNLGAARQGDERADCYGDRLPHPLRTLDADSRQNDPADDQDDADGDQPEAMRLPDIRPAEGAFAGDGCVHPVLYTGQLRGEEG